MPNPIFITQNDPRGAVLSPVYPSSSGILNAVVAGWIKPGTVVTPHGALLSTGEGYDVHVAGIGLGQHSLGNWLDTGTVYAINVMSPSGMVLASLGNAVPGGLNLSIDALQDAFRNPEKLDALVADWAITFSAQNSIPAGSDPALPGVTFEGARGTDQLTGSLASDDLRGGAGDDRIWGLLGNDFLRGDHTAHLGSDAPTGNDTLYGGDGSDWVYGEGGHDSVYGGNGNDHLKGDEPWQTPGNDLMSGEDGNDFFYSEGGNDTYLGGAGRDKLTILGSSGVALCTVNLVTGVMTGEGNDVLSGIEIVQGVLEAANHLTGGSAAEAFAGGFLEDSLSGGGGQDRLWGDFGNDVIKGGGGDDRLAGDGGADTVWGGTGRDAFLFNGNGADRVEDFAAADDQIWLVTGIAPDLTGTGRIASGQFKDLSLGSVDSTDRLIYKRSTGELYLDADGSGSAARSLLARFDAGTALSAADIELHAPWDRNDFLV